MKTMTSMTLDNTIYGNNGTTITWLLWLLFHCWFVAFEVGCGFIICIYHCSRLFPLLLWFLLSFSCTRVQHGDIAIVLVVAIVSCLCVVCVLLFVCCLLVVVCVLFVGCCLCGVCWLFVCWFKRMLLRLLWPWCHFYCYCHYGHCQFDCGCCDCHHCHCYCYRAQATPLQQQHTNVMNDTTGNHSNATDNIMMKIIFLSHFESLLPPLLSAGYLPVYCFQTLLVIVIAAVWYCCLSLLLFVIVVIVVC